MQAEHFMIIGEPTRLRILGALQDSNLAVGELVSRLKISQPAISKHLKVLRDAGFVRCHRDAQRRIYALEAEPFREIDEWLAPFRKRWSQNLDALESFLDSEH